MRIAIVHALQRGGAARRVASTAVGLAQAPGVDLREFSLRGSVAVAPDREEVDWQPGAPGRPAAARPVWRYRDMLGARHAWDEVWARVEGWSPDAVFVNPCAVPLGAPPGLDGVRTPSLYYCDEPRRIDYERAAARQSRPLTRVPYYPMRRLQRRDERASVAAATSLATNSDYTAERIRAAYGRDAVVISPGIDDAFTPGHVAGDSGHVLTVGTLIPSKGHDLVIAAVAASGARRPVHVVAPRADAVEEARLRALATEGKVVLRIETGVTDERLVDLYRGAWTTMYLARDEPLGLVSLEAQACGSPVVVSDEGGLPETVVAGVTGLAVARDVESAAAALRVLAEPGRREEMGRHARERDFPRSSAAAQVVLRALQEIAGRRS